MKPSDVPTTGVLWAPTGSAALTPLSDPTPPPGDHARRYPPITIKIASTRAEREGAFRLVYQRYLAAGLCPPNPWGMRVTPYHLLPTTTVFVAIYQGEVIFTMSLIGDGEQGVPMESTFPDEIRSLRERGIMFGEVSCLADRRRSMARFLSLFTRVSRTVLQFARAQGIEPLVIAVHPKHGPFYERIFGFEQMGGTRLHGSVMNKPAVAYSLDHSRFNAERHAQYFGVPIPPEELQPQPLSEEELIDFRRAAVPLGASELLSGGYELSQESDAASPQ
jgi:hypothetical protein